MCLSKSIASTLVVSSSDEDTEIQSSPQSPEDGNQSIGIYRRTRFQLALRRTTPTAPPTENDTNDPPPTPQLTNDNPLTDLHSRQRAPLKQLSRCFEDHTRNEPSTSGTPDEEVDYGSCGSCVNPSIIPILISKWSTSENDSQY